MVVIQLEDQSLADGEGGGAGDDKSDKPLTFDSANITKRGATHFGELEDVGSSLFCSLQHNFCALCQ